MRGQAFGSSGVPQLSGFGAAIGADIGADIGIGWAGAGACPCANANEIGVNPASVAARINLRIVYLRYQRPNVNVICRSWFHRKAWFHHEECDEPLLELQASLLEPSFIGRSSGASLFHIDYVARKLQLLSGAAPPPGWLRND
jgi:hypothetical protein